MQRVIKIIHTESSEPRRKQEDTTRNKRRFNAWLDRLQKAWLSNDDWIAGSKYLAARERLTS